MKKLLMILVFCIAGSVDLFAGKTFRNSKDEPHAKKNALKGWTDTSTKKGANRAGQSVCNSKLKKAQSGVLESLPKTK